LHCGESYRPILLQKSAALQVRNFRIQWARRLNQSCAAGLFFESMLRVGMRKIFLQQYLPCVDGPELARAFFTFAVLVGAAMCSAFKCGTQGRWP
jgi:hypothetical protein